MVNPRKNIFGLKSKVYRKPQAMFTISHNGKYGKRLPIYHDILDGDHSVGGIRGSHNPCEDAESRLGSPLKMKQTNSWEVMGVQLDTLLPTGSVSPILLIRLTNYVYG